MRTPLVVGNWKMHGTLAEARPLASAVRDGLRRVKGAEVAVWSNAVGPFAAAFLMTT